MHIRVSDKMKTLMPQLVEAIQKEKFFRPTLGEAAEYAVTGMLEVLTTPAALTPAIEAVNTRRPELTKKPQRQRKSATSLIPKKQTSRPGARRAKKAGHSTRAAKAAK